MAENYTFPNNFSVIGASGKGMEIWSDYLTSIQNCDVLVIAMGGNDICEHPYKDQPTLLMNAVSSLVADIQNFCNRVGTKLIVASILPRDSSGSSEVVIGQMNNRFKTKFKPHYRKFQSKLNYRGDLVHFLADDYFDLAEEVILFAKTALAARGDKVDQNRLPMGY